MTEVVSIKFKNRGKSYYFDPCGLSCSVGDELIVDTANGLEYAVCSAANHMVDDTAVIQPLRRVLRAATRMDQRVEEINRQREQEAMELCRVKIADHGLDMKLVDVECNFEGNKTTFFFTADGRVDFRELVKDLASVLHNRIELRQIGVRDEAKMLGGLGICGRPYCCSLFMDDFRPVSTKMAKVQSLSLNPTKISGSCGRLMCCLRYEEEAYEELVKKVPRQGAFVETKDGYGTAVQVNLLRSTVKVRLDNDRDDTLHEYKDYELTAVPGGRPKDGSEPPHVLEYVEPEAEAVEEEPVDEWVIPEFSTSASEQASSPDESIREEGSGSRRNRNRRNRKGHETRQNDGSARESARRDASPVAVSSETLASGGAGEKTGEARASRRPKKKKTDRGGAQPNAAPRDAAPVAASSEARVSSGKAEKIDPAPSKSAVPEEKPKKP